MKTTAFIIAACASLFFSSAKAASPYKANVTEALQTTLDARNLPSGIWDKAGWWNSANVLTAVIRYAEVTGNKDEVIPVIDDVFEKSRNVKEKNFINDYYDDEGWWLLAWIDAYKLTGDKKYLDMAEVIFTDMKGGWTPECGGGIWWKKPGVYKNAIANSLFNLSAARLYKETKNPEYLEWFRKNLTWFAASGMIKADTGLVDDGTKDCKPTNGSYYTYNQGVALAALTEMYLISKEKKYLEQAHAIARATLKGMVYENGILKEPAEPKSLGADGVQFKGIFLRHLGFLNSVSPKKEYKQFIRANADSIIANAYDPATKSYGAFWIGPFDNFNPGSHSSAMECLIEAYKITK